MTALRWKCHARPASLGGKTCGHVQAWSGKIIGGRVCCEECGCTKKASDDREKEAGNGRGKKK